MQNRTKALHCQFFPGLKFPNWGKALNRYPTYQKQLRKRSRAGQGGFCGIFWTFLQCIFGFWKNSLIRNKQMFTNARAFSRVSYFLYFFCFSHMFCGKKVVVVFLWNHIHICMPSFWFFIFVCNEKFHRNIKTLLLIIQFCLCILNSPRSKYFIKFSLMVFDSQICSANTIPQVRSCWLITH